MDTLPAVNMGNIKLLALWVLVLIFVLMFWHFALRTTERAL